jgi:hypothetical protein
VAAALGYGLADRATTTVIASTKVRSDAFIVPTLGDVEVTEPTSEAPHTWHNELPKQHRVSAASTAKRPSTDSIPQMSMCGARQRYSQSHSANSSSSAQSRFSNKRKSCPEQRGGRQHDSPV